MSDDQSRANALVEQANALHNAGSKLDAAPLYLQAVKLFPVYASFALVAGDSFREGGHDDEAIDAYRTCLAGEPDHEQAWLGLGQVLFRQGAIDEAREAYQHAGLPFPGDRKGCLQRLFGG